MKKYSWKDVVFINFPKLKEIRESENIIVPNEYTDLNKKMCAVIGVFGFISGFLLGGLVVYLIGEL